MLKPDTLRPLVFPFDDYLRASMRANASDLRLYEPDRDLPTDLLLAEIQREAPSEIPLARDPSWYPALESYLPTIQSAANMLVSGVEVTPDVVKALLADCERE